MSAEFISGFFPEAWGVLQVWGLDQHFFPASLQVDQCQVLTTQLLPGLEIRWLTLLPFCLAGALVGLASMLLFSGQLGLEHGWGQSFMWFGLMNLVAVPTHLFVAPSPDSTAFLVLRALDVGCTGAACLSALHAALQAMRSMNIVTDRLREGKPQGSPPRSSHQTDQRASSAQHGKEGTPSKSTPAAGKASAAAEKDSAGAQQDDLKAPKKEGQAADGVSQEEGQQGKPEEGRESEAGSGAEEAGDADRHSTNASNKSDGEATEVSKPSGSRLAAAETPGKTEAGAVKQAGAKKPGGSKAKEGQGVQEGGDQQDSEQQDGSSKQEQAQEQHGTPNAKGRHGQGKQEGPHKARSGGLLDAWVRQGSMGLLASNMVLMAASLAGNLMQVPWTSELFYLGAAALAIGVVGAYLSAALKRYASSAVSLGAAIAWAGFGLASSGVPLDRQLCAATEAYVTHCHVLFLGCIVIYVGLMVHLMGRREGDMMLAALQLVYAERKAGLPRGALRTAIQEARVVRGRATAGSSMARSAAQRSGAGQYSAGRAQRGDPDRRGERLFRDQVEGERCEEQWEEEEEWVVGSDQEGEEGYCVFGVVEESGEDEEDEEIDVEEFLRWKAAVKARRGKKGGSAGAGGGAAARKRAGRSTKAPVQAALAESDHQSEQEGAGVAGEERTAGEDHAQAEEGEAGTAADSGKGDS